MAAEKTGILLAGTMLTDNIKVIDSYPEMGLLSNIREVSQAVGGCVPNTVINLAKIDPKLPLYAAGRIGDDPNGRYLMCQLIYYGINYEEVSVSLTANTSFSDAMSLRSGERTFFHYRGANAEFGPEHIQPEKWNCRIAHFGYVLLLDRLDKADKQYGTVMARLLHRVQEQGIKTSIDAVSDCNGNYAKTLLPALAYSNYVIVNEIEGTAAWEDLPPRTEDGRLHRANICEAMRRMAECGVKDKIIIHAKEAAFVYDVPTARVTVLPSLCIPKEEIVGSTGAGDAFCAGSLYGLYNGYDDLKILEFASAAAACNLTCDNAVDGMKNADEVWTVAAKYPRLALEGVMG